MRLSTFVAAFAFGASIVAKRIVVTVRTDLTANGTEFDASSVFRPQQIKADVGDQVLFNFTQGNHSVVRSTFDQPCVPISEHSPVNGFNSGYRPTNNGTAITEMVVDIDASLENITIWFYDGNTCGLGGVGAINVNESSWESFDGYERNAKRLFGPNAGKETSTSTTRPTDTSSGDSPQGTDSAEGDGVLHVASVSAFAVLAAGVALLL